MGVRPTARDCTESLRLTLVLHPIRGEPAFRHVGEAFFAQRRPHRKSQRLRLAEDRHFDVPADEERPLVDDALIRGEVDARLELVVRHESTPGRFDPETQRRFGSDLPADGALPGHRAVCEQDLGGSCAR